MDAFIGEIRAFAFPFVTSSWAACNGQIININQSIPLFSIIGITFGGNGSTTFGLPNLNGNLAVGAGQAQDGSNWYPGQITGSSTVTLNQTQMAMHNHNIGATSNQATSRSGIGNQLALSSIGDLDNPYDSLIYVNANPGTTLSPQSLAMTGSGSAHTNAMPSLVLNYCICLNGIYPSFS